MRYFRPMYVRFIPRAVLIAIITLFSGSFAEAQIFNDPFRNIINNLSTQNRRLPPRDFKNITQDFLDSVRVISSEEKQGFYKLKLPFSMFDFNTSSYQRIYLKRGNSKNGVLEGRLMAVDTHGIYLYHTNNQIFRFVSYDHIKFIRRGRTLERKMVRDLGYGVASGAVLGAFGSILSGDAEYAIVFAIIGGSFGVFVPVFTFIPQLVVHGIQNTDPEIKTPINYNRRNLINYSQMVSRDPYRYGSRLLHADFPRVIPLVDTAAAVVVQNEIPPNNPSVTLSKPIDTPTVSNPNKVTPEPLIEAVGVVQKEVKSSPETIENRVEASPQPVKVAERLSDFKEGKFIAAVWMYRGFNTKAVDVKRMMRMFPNLRFDRLSESDASAFKNKDEVRYAAMTIGTQIGYDFTKVAVFSESQETDLTQALPFYNVETVASNTLIKSKALSDIDAFNLQFLYNLLKLMP